MSAFSYPLADWLNVDLGSLIPIVIPLAVFVLAGVIVVSAMYFHNRRREMWHQTARLALEKGQPLPPLDDAPPVRPPSRDTGWNDVRAGLICMATGLGLFLFLGTFIGRGLGYVGAIPGFVGVALLLTGLFRMMGSKKRSVTDPGSPLA